MLELYWIPLGAGQVVVRCSGWVYECLVAASERRPRRRLYHAAMVAGVDGRTVTVEVAPVPDDDGGARGAVAGGPVGSRVLGRWRLFRYEVRRWDGGTIPDLRWAVGGPVRLTDDPSTTRRVLEVVGDVPPLVWGRDELDVGDMWNSNSVVSAALARTGLLERAGAPPRGGRAPGWSAGAEAVRLGLLDGATGTA